MVLGVGYEGSLFLSYHLINLVGRQCCVYLPLLLCQCFCTVSIFKKMAVPFSTNNC